MFDNEYVTRISFRDDNNTDTNKAYCLNSFFCTNFGKL